MLRRDDAAGWGTSKDSATNLVDGSSATHVVHSDAAVIDVQDLHVMDRLLLRGQQLNQKVQRKAAEFAMRRHDELQRVLSTNEWETGASTKDCAGPNRSRRRSVPS